MTVTTNASTTAAQDPARVRQSLRASLQGRVIGPEDADYDAARTIVLGGVDRRPAAIARVADADDVARVIALAARSGSSSPSAAAATAAPATRRPRAASSSTSAT